MALSLSERREFELMNITQAAASDVAAAGPGHAV